MAAHAPAKLENNSFDWADPLLLDRALSEEERMVRDSAREFCGAVLMPAVKDGFRNETFDRSLMKQMGEVGFLGMTLPEEYGGAGMNYTCYGLVAREVERIDSGYRSAMSVQNTLVMHPIFAYGSEEQRKKYLPKLASGEFVGCFGLTEPDHGSDPGGMITRADKVQGGYVLNGAKMWITNSPIADLAVVWAKLDGKIRGFIVERDAKGFTTPKIEGKFSPARLRHRRNRAGRLPCRRGCAAAECGGPVRSLRLPQPRALRHRLGRHGRSRVLFPCRAPIHARPQAVRPSAGRQPADPEEAGRHADRDHAGPQRRAASGPSDG